MTDDMHNPITPQLHPEWMTVLQQEFHKPYMKTLREFLKQEIIQGKIIYPHGKEIFSALNTTPFSQVKVVIIGQDPYHGPSQAHGMCFSVRPGIPIPPSLQNIFKELQKDLNLPIPQHGYLQYWAEQGVLLLNNVLTVENGKAHSHQHKGWEMFTDHIIFQLNQLKEHLVFLLWGSAAQEKGRHIDRKKHLVLQSVHPSPLSAYRGFLGNRHFSKTNDYLKMNDMLPIDWSLPDLHHKQGDNKPMNHSFRPSELF